MKDDTLEKKYTGVERREFIRLNYVKPLACKICKKETINKILQGYTANISQSGLLCNIKEKVHKEDILWLSFDRSTLEICHDLEKGIFVYQNGIIGEVVRIETRKDGSFDVGVRFITREEKNLTNIYPKVHFLEQKDL